jgi:cytochrome c peroxidase
MENAHTIHVHHARLYLFSFSGPQRFEPECSWGANAGLAVARNALAPVKSKFPEISYADLYTYAGVVAVEEAGGPKIPFRLGRSDMEDGSTSPPDGRLPDADKGARVHTIQHMRDIFYRMGFSDGEIVALL